MTGTTGHGRPHAQPRPAAIPTNPVATITIQPVAQHPPAPGSALARAWRACQPALARLHQQQLERTDPHATRQQRPGRVERDHARERG
jgi:hypothetical protein